MKCARCSAEIPRQSQFCLRCGAPIAGTAANPTGMTPASAMPLPKPNNRPLLLTIAALALVAVGLGAMVVRGQLTQKPGVTQNGTLVQAPGVSNNNNLVQAPGESEPPKMVQQPSEAPPQPTDVMDYLAHVRRVEASKQSLIKKQTGDALMMLTQAKALSATIEEQDYNNTFSGINKNMNYSANDWNDLTVFFESKSPPESCRDLHDKYYDQLGKIQSMIVAVNDALSKVQSDPSGAISALTQMQGRASQDADAAILAADEALAEVCSKYRLKKDFDIKGDSGSASLLR